MVESSKKILPITGQSHSVVLADKETEIVSSCAVANTAWKRMKGLLGKKHMERTEGLWIAPCTSIHTFFMGMPIDAAFIDGQGKILAVYENMVPWRLSWFHWSAAGVLETSPGLFREKNVKAGQRIRFRPSDKKNEQKGGVE